MALDEYLFGKFANYFKRRRENALSVSEQIVQLDDIKGRLTIFARAITGASIAIYPAEREGGYKNNNFFLPAAFSEMPTYELNISFYLFRVVYLSVQKNLSINWRGVMEHSLQESRENALKSSTKILETIFEEFPPVEKIFYKIKNHYQEMATEKVPVDFTFLYGKWMKNDAAVSTDNQLRNFNEKAKKAIEDEIKTILKAKPVEEVITLEVDEKQQEDYVMTHNFEKIDTAEEHDGGWRDFDGEDDMDKHGNALEELNMKYTVRVDDAVHSVYQADFVENTTVSESATMDGNGYYVTYDEWDHKKRRYKRDFCKVYPKALPETNADYYRKTILKNAGTLMGLRKMLTNVNNKFQQQRRQTQGEEFDIDAITDLYVDVQSGHTPSEKIYLSNRKKEKDLSILMLLDTSLSSDGYAADNKVIDVEKQVSILFGEM